MQSLLKENKSDRFLSFCIVFQIILLGCKNVLVQGVPFLYDINEKLNIIILALSTFFYILAYFKTFSRNIGGSYYAFATFIAFSFGVTYICFPQNIVYLNAYILRTLICCIFTGFLISKLRRLDYLVSYLLKGSYFISFSLILYVIEIRIIGHSTTSGWSSYSMTMSNVGLIAVMFQLHDFFKNRSKISLLLALIGCIVIFLYGSRNPFIAIVLYVIVQVLEVNRDGRKTENKVFLFVSAIFTFLLLLNSKMILLAIASLLDSFGLSSRSLYYLINETNEDITTGRAEIHDEIWSVIWDNPILGTGIAGDEANIHELAHSLYISVYCTWGIFIGTLFLLFVFAQCYNAHKSSYGLNHQILVVFMCMVFPRGFTGGDIWQSDVFWWMMGIVFFILTNRYQTVK